jgi:hypothetical protein
MSAGFNPKPGHVRLSEYCMHDAHRIYLPKAQHGMCHVIVVV